MQGEAYSGGRVEVGNARAKIIIGTGSLLEVSLYLHTFDIW